MLHKGMKGSDLFSYRNIIYYNCLRYNSTSPLLEIEKPIKDCLDIKNLDIAEKCLIKYKKKIKKEKEAENLTSLQTINKNLDNKEKFASNVTAQ